MDIILKRKTSLHKVICFLAFWSRGTCYIFSQIQMRRKGFLIINLLTVIQWVNKACRETTLHKVEDKSSQPQINKPTNYLTDIKFHPLFICCQSGGVQHCQRHILACNSNISHHNTILLPHICETIACVISRPQYAQHVLSLSSYRS